MRRETLIVFAKPPRIGLSKTRLAAGAGKTMARRIARFTLARTLRAARGSACRTVIYTSPDSVAQARSREPAFAGFALRPQGEGTLTDRLERALDEAPPGPILFVGSDCPDISSARINSACRALSRSDAVFGPARDGGFWLFGMHTGNRRRSPFRDVRWSGPHALQDVHDRLPPRSRVTFLTTLPDIDTLEDWQDWVRSTA
jgi:rSAM/selenodomain-associated transferase 1